MTVRGACSILLGDAARNANRLSSRKILRAVWTASLFSSLAFCAGARAQSSIPAAVGADALNSDIQQFLDREIAADVADIHTLDPPPDRVLGALTTGEFSWGTFMRSLAAYSQLTGQHIVAGQNVIRLIAQMGLIESRRGGKPWAQLYAAESLETFGTDLSANPLWLGLSPEEKEAWRGLLDPGRFYDVKTHHVINLPENYLGVAARIAAISYRLGIATDRAYVDDLLDRAADQFTHGTLFADDGLPTGRFDRYSNEYARDVYLAAEAVGRTDIEHALEASLHEQMRLWWSILSPDGYGYNWGRTIGDISYLDTLEITAFLCAHPQFSPASLTQLATTYDLAWRSLRRDYQDQTHLLSLFAFGRAQYHYMTIGRLWQQTAGFFAKVATTDAQVVGALRKAGIANFPAVLDLPDAAGFTWFRHAGGGVRPAGVWVVRQGSMRFALPFVTGTEATMSDYEPAPHGLPGFAVPVEQNYPCLVPFLELENGQVIAAADGADEIRPSTDGRSLTAIWTHWAIVGGKAGDRLDPAITATVTWSLRGGALHRAETLHASKPVTIRRWWMAVPTTGDRLETTFANGARVDRVLGEEATLELRVTSADWPIRISSFAPGDGALGKGARRPIPLHLLLNSPGFVLKPGRPLHWEMDLRSSPPQVAPAPSAP